MLEKHLSLDWTCRAQQTCLYLTESWISLTKIKVNAITQIGRPMPASTFLSRPHTQRSFFFGKKAVAHALFRFNTSEVLILALGNTWRAAWPLRRLNFEKHASSMWRTIEGWKTLQPREQSVSDKVWFPRESTDRVQAAASEEIPGVCFFHNIRPESVPHSHTEEILTQ